MPKLTACTELAEVLNTVEVIRTIIQRQKKNIYIPDLVTPWY